MQIRKPFVANQFYPGSSDSLRHAVEGYISSAHSTAEEKAVALIAPHAGYMYSGKTAGEAFARVIVPESVVLIGPNHTGLGDAFAVMTKGTWETPLGNLDIDEDLAEAILDSSRLFTADTLAHEREHSLEVEMPFIYIKNPKAKIVPITVMSSSQKACEDAGAALAKAIRKHKKKTLIVVSSDMNHYESDEITRKKDRLAIDKVLALDPEGLLKVIKEHRITMCGAIPAAIALYAAKELGATKATLAGHTTSAEASGDTTYTVGYAGFVIK
ncbi:MAG: AmmeMemoRadiSam system protein B [Deltaproteobacteria bacterium]|nr:AmmeMemoRadiSam system protein B [Deltaproteobacteria bacterium]